MNREDSETGDLVQTDVRVDEENFVALQVKMTLVTIFKCRLYVVLDLLFLAGKLGSVSVAYTVGGGGVLVCM